MRMVIPAMLAVFTCALSNLFYFFTYTYDPVARAFDMTVGLPELRGWLFLLLSMAPSILLVLYMLNRQTPTRASGLALGVMGTFALQQLTVGVHNLLSLGTVLKTYEAVSSILMFIVGMVEMLLVGVLFAYATVMTARKPANHAAVMGPLAWPGLILAPYALVSLLWNLRYYLAWSQYIPLLSSLGNLMYLTSFFVTLWLIGRERLAEERMAAASAVGPGSPSASL